MTTISSDVWNITWMSDLSVHLVKWLSGTWANMDPPLHQISDFYKHRLKCYTMAPSWVTPSTDIIEQPSPKHKVTGDPYESIYWNLTISELVTLNMSTNEKMGCNYIIEHKLKMSDDWPLLVPLGRLDNCMNDSWLVSRQQEVLVFQLRGDQWHPFLKGIIQRLNQDKLRFWNMRVTSTYLAICFHHTDDNGHGHFKFVLVFSLHLLFFKPFAPRVI